MNLKHTRTYQELKKIIVYYLYFVITNKIQGFIDGLRTIKDKDGNVIEKTDGGILDVWDDRNITAEELEIVTGDTPISIDFSHNLSEYQNQLESDFLPGISCGPHSQSMALDIAGLNTLKKVWRRGPQLTREMYDEGFMFSFGSYLLDHGKYPLSKGWISGYYIAHTPEQARAHLATGQGMLIGTNRLTFGWNIENQRYEYGMASPGRQGHLMCGIPEYNEEGMWVADPFRGIKAFLYWKDYKYLFYSRLCLTNDKKFNIINEVKVDTPRILKEMKKRYKKDSSARIACYSYLIKKHKEENKKYIRIGMRLALGKNVEEYMI